MTAVLLLTPAAASLAQPVARDAERERRIEQQLQLISPEAVPAFRAATASLDKNDFVEAARLYQRVLELAPRFSPALRRLGISLVEAGYREGGLRFIEQAVQFERSADGASRHAAEFPEPFVRVELLPRPLGDLAGRRGS